MGLDQSHRAVIEKARSVGSADLALPLDDGACAYLLTVIVKDLSLQKRVPELSAKVTAFFGSTPPESLTVPGVDFWRLIERLVEVDSNVVTYFSCLAVIHKARLKYARILQTQPLPTMDQVGPRGLLQYGSVSPRALAGLLMWRKWLYDIDNRAAQETGYLFEPIIAHAIGGVPVSAKKSPIRRRADAGKGRQVDCIRQKKAYEIKLRVTIAASGQGRWNEELEFPADCRASGYAPVLIVFDPTSNPKLTQLQKAFLDQKGEVYVGPAAWRHLDEAAGPTMAKFLDRYVRDPMQALLKEVLPRLPEISLVMEDSSIKITVAGESFTIERRGSYGTTEEEKILPDDVDETTPGL